MSLSNLLNELQEDLDPESKVVATEDIIKIVDGVNNTEYDTSYFNSDSIANFNIIYNQYRLKNIIESQTKVDMALAEEAFTMLQENVVSSVKARLTPYPSAINKGVLADLFEEGTGETSAEAIDMVRSLWVVLNDKRESLSDLNGLLSTYKDETLKPEQSRLKNPLVMQYGKTYPLLTTPMSVISNLDDSKFDYPKYLNVLSGMYRDVITNTSMSDLIVENLRDLTLGEVTSKLIHLAEEFNRRFERIEAFRLKAIELFGSNDTSVEAWREVVNSSCEITDILKAFNAMHSASKSNCFLYDLVCKLLKYID